MRFIAVLLLLLLFSSVPAAAQTPEPVPPQTHNSYCAGLIGNSLAFAFASGVSVAVPTLSAGFMAASLAMALAAVVVC